MWKSDENKWELIGDVQMPQSQSKPLALYEGDSLFPAGEYDHVFDVDAGDGII